MSRFTWSWTADDKDSRPVTLALDEKGEIYLLMAKNIPPENPQDYIKSHLSPHHAVELSEWLARAVYRRVKYQPTDRRLVQHLPQTQAMMAGVVTELGDEKIT